MIIDLFYINYCENVNFQYVLLRREIIYWLYTMTYVITFYRFNRSCSFIHDVFIFSYTFTSHINRYIIFALSSFLHSANCHQTIHEFYKQVYRNRLKKLLIHVNSYIFFSNILRNILSDYSNIKE